jgi:hypothetical protein
MPVDAWILYQLMRISFYVYKVVYAYSWNVVVCCWIVAVCVYQDTYWCNLVRRTEVQSALMLRSTVLVVVIMYMGIVDLSDEYEVEQR